MYLTNVYQVIVVNNLLGKLKKKIALISLFVDVACYLHLFNNEINSFFSFFSSSTRTHRCHINLFAFFCVCERGGEAEVGCEVHSLLHCEYLVECIVHIHITRVRPKVLSTIHQI